MPVFPTASSFHFAGIDTMQKFAYHDRNIYPYLIIALTFAMYMAVFANFWNKVGIAIAALAIGPILCAAWYFGLKGGLVMVGLTFLANTFLLGRAGYDFTELTRDPGNLMGGFIVYFMAILFGWVSTVAHERRDALIKLKKYERERDLHANFLEKLDRITALALEPDSLQTTLEILTEQLAGLFHAEEGFFTLWDSERELPIPIAAFGSLKDTYPLIRFEPGEVTLSSSLMQMEQPIPVVDIKDTPFIGPRAAAIFPSQSMLGIPFITQKRKLGAILLGYKERHEFIPEELFQAQITSDQVALVLSKLQMLEDERKQLRQLTALHDVALTSIQVENEDQLIERVTGIIGNNLFPDNFGIMLLHEQEQFVYPHPSYRFYKTEKLAFNEIPLGKGITGRVAQNGQPRRTGNVRESEDYLDMDENTRSELCVPIRFKERILGVINAESTQPDAFSEEDERLLVTLAGQLATAIEQLRRAQAERKWFDQLAHASDLIYSIAHITTQIEKSLSVNEIIKALGRELDGIGLTCIMAVYDSTLKSFTINYTSLRLPLLEIVESALGYPLIEYIFPRSRFESLLESRELSQPTVLLDPAEEIKALFTQINERGIPLLLQKIGVEQDVEPMRLPLVFEENLLGILWVWGKGITSSDLPILSIFAKQISNSLERARLFEEVQSLALTDPLTGLQNRRSVFEVGRIEFSRAQRMKRPFSCMMLDLDHFKKINDQFGHQSGDQILQDFAACCLTSVRDGDLVGRYGGEEIIILLPETDREMAMLVAERLGAAVAEQPFKTLDNEIFVTVSIGVAAMDENTTHFESLIARADQALYIAKHKGRNRVAVSV
jgi:diguanylate cyclase (GGDEF)-like protein